ncbi:MAG: hypothetical protein JNN12_14415 [Bacteroidetes Order II. Incertae sedis bacterium]|nr:hypothetical protein [Bacteroidetes Order II. bacterium]
MNRLYRLLFFILVLCLYPGKDPLYGQIPSSYWNYGSLGIENTSSHIGLSVPAKIDQSANAELIKKDSAIVSSLATEQLYNDQCTNRKIEIALSETRHKKIILPLVDKTFSHPEASVQNMVQDRRKIIDYHYTIFPKATEKVYDSTAYLCSSFSDQSTVPQEYEAVTLSIPTHTAFAFSPTRNKVIVLLHGITPFPNHDPDARIATHFHPRYYWGSALLSNLLGMHQADNFTYLHPRKNPNGTLSMVNGTSFPASKWDFVFDKKQYQSLNQTIDEIAFPDLAPVLVDLPNGPFAQRARGAKQPFTAAMITFREGHLHLVEQTEQAILQIYHTYQAIFGALDEKDQPQIYLLGHSFGGIVARAILSNPENRDPVSGKQLSAPLREKATFIRDRTVWLSTLSTPHEGSPTPRFANELHSDFQALKNELGSLKPPKQYLPVGVSGNLSVDQHVRKKIESAQNVISAAQAAISAYRPVFDDLMQIHKHNTSFIPPHTSKRSDGSLIPVYTMAGRSPGHYFFDRQRHLLASDEIDVLGLMTNRAGMEASVLLLTDLLISRLRYGRLTGSTEPCRPWGMVSQSGRIPEGDRRTAPRLCSALSGTKIGTLRNGYGLSASATGDVLATTILGAGYYGSLSSSGYASGHNSPDNEYDSDGFVSFPSSHGIGIKGTHWFGIYGDRYGTLLPWELDNHGSLMFNPATGRWIRDYLLQFAGPYLTQQGSTRISLYDPQNTRPPSEANVLKNKVKVEILEIKALEELDPEDEELRKAEALFIGLGQKKPTLTGADFRLRVDISGISCVKRFKDNQSHVREAAVFSEMVFGTMIPIRIALDDIDTEPPNAEDREDLLDPCTITPAENREDLFLYYDISRKQIFGDVAQFKTGQKISIVPHPNAPNRVQITLRISH